MDLEKKLFYTVEHIENAEAEKKEKTGSFNDELKTLKKVQHVVKEAIKFKNPGIIEEELDTWEQDLLKGLGPARPNNARMRGQFLAADNFSEKVSNGCFVLAKTRKGYLCSFALLNPAALSTENLFGGVEQYTDTGDTVELAIQGAITKIKAMQTEAPAEESEPVNAEPIVEGKFNGA